MELSFRIKKPADFIFDYLTDMQKFVSVHPLITQIDLIGNDRYLIHETLKIGLVPFSFTYPVTVTNNQRTGLVVIQATIMKLTKVEMTFKLNQDGDSTLVEESIIFKSPLPIKSIMENMFKKQHIQLFKNIEQASK